MAIELKEVFQIAAPIDDVWQFMLDPDRMIPCLPGASVTEIVSDDQFVGTVKLKIGAITAKYSGTITYTTRDAEAYRCVMRADAKEKGGGTVSGTITTNLTQKDGAVEAVVESSIDMTGRVVQVGRGMIEGVASEIIGKFVKNIRSTLEVPDTPAAEATTTGTGEQQAQPAPGASSEEQPQPRTYQRQPEDDSINVLAVTFKVMWRGIVNFFRRLFRRSSN